MQICFLWHFHQPDYQRNADLFLPWVRLHGSKDYRDLPLMIANSGLHQTINVVPSLLRQLDAYGLGATDPILELCAIPPSQRIEGQQKEIARWITTLQYQTMALSLPRMAELWDRLQLTAGSGAGVHLTEEEFTDAEVLFHLAWTGPVSRSLPVAQRLLRQGRNFSREDLTALLKEHHSILADVVTGLDTLQQSGSIEVSVSPFHHPILPLLIDSNAASECMPHSPLPIPPFSEHEDAAWNVFSALNDWRRRTGVTPNGMWPSEGSVSLASLALQAAAGVKWTATDEAVLQNTLGTNWTPAAHLLPYELTTDFGLIRMLFRDHELSDAIGFTYATWNPHDAVEDFMTKLNDRRVRIEQYIPAELHKHAVIPIILDGENCWEYYADNGKHFLSLLFNRLNESSELNCVTVTEATSGYALPLQSVVAGSWIGGDFDIWIGNEIKNKAWGALREARTLVQDQGNQADMLAIVRSLEASDYFWWYDSRHVAPHKAEFDRAFRNGLAEIYKKYDMKVPEELLQTSFGIGDSPDNTVRLFPISYDNIGTMHNASALLKSVSVETSGNWQRLVFVMSRRLYDAESVGIVLADRHGLERTYRIHSSELLSRSAFHDEGTERMSPVSIAIYVHATNEWSLTVEDAYSDGTTATTHLTIVL